MRIPALLTFCATNAVVAQQFVLDSMKESRQSAERSSLVQPVYKPFTLGSIKPSGWMKDQLELEAAGLAGNMFDFYRFVDDSRWLGGSSDYSNLNEGSPYWFNGLVPLAFGLDDSRLKSQVKFYLDYVLDHQQSDGWIGPETTPETRGIWSRCIVLLGLMQYADADPTETDRIVDAMHRFVDLAHSMLENNYTGLIDHNKTYDPDGFGVARAHEMHIPLQWLYENHPRDNGPTIWETMELMISGGVAGGADWSEFWVKGVYPEVYYDKVTPFDLTWLFLHGVNHAQGLRWPLAVYRMTQESALKQQTRDALDLLWKSHTSISGTIIGDEMISDLNPFRGSELCTAAEIMFSLAYIYTYLDDNDIADWAELVAYNALPASVSSDWWAHQYVQQENQPWSRKLTNGTGFWWNVNEYGNVFGLEPNYPCCTVNHPQALPKFLAHSFGLREDGGIIHILLGPAHLKTTIGDNDVEILVDTDYPFGMTLNYSVSTTSGLDFYVRMPSWASVESTLQVGGTAEKLSPSDKGLQRISLAGGDQKVSVTFDTDKRVEFLLNNTAAIYYGPLLYSLVIEYNDTVTDPLDYGSHNPLGSSTTSPGHTHDHTMVPTTKWNIAIDPSQIYVVFIDPDDPLKNPIWELGAPPVELHVAAIEIEWPLAYDSPAAPPTTLITKGEPFSARFAPFGSTKLHMSRLPVLPLPKVDLRGDSYP